VATQSVLEEEAENLRLGPSDPLHRERELLERVREW
jgi:hypothetical protein